MGAFLRAPARKNRAIRSNKNAVCSRKRSLGLCPKLRKQKRRVFIPLLSLARLKTRIHAGFELQGFAPQNPVHVFRPASLPAPLRGLFMRLSWGIGPSSFLFSAYLLGLSYQCGNAG
jgi:hypothetical protein